ncbi:hypothetical protein SeMB42_g00836 [Synchytrium endobioticum]|uniref:Uncharacterized protein n=1 Tax=Synchytrium endobioticum TaxID=286115 RepID=A0A507DNQ2_9FUNG|nr:hypothetical protein SeLEV6574_g01801 [Synchytrium endobioticum]TPX53349.1 hypothetical protein SeMB42_g00836 [Synchytrium endobioticum]
MSARQDQDQDHGPLLASAEAQPAPVAVQAAARAIASNTPVVDAPAVYRRTSDDARALFDEDDDDDDVAGHAASSGGWAAWGSWASRLADVASNTIAQTGDKIYETLDPEYERQKLSLREREARARAMPGADNGDTPSHADTAALPTLDPLEISKHAATAAEALLAKMDQGLNTVSDAVGSTLFTGYRKIDETVDALRKDAATHHVVQQTKELSHDALASGLAALEGLGHSAMQWFGSPRPVHQPPPPLHAAARTSFTSMFDDQPGGATLKAIESLSTAASRQVATLLSQSSTPVDMTAVDLVFDVDSMVEDAEAIAERPFSNDQEFETLLSAIAPLAPPASSILTKVLDAVKPCELSTSEKLRFFNVLYEKKTPSDTTIEEFADGLYLDILSAEVALAERWCTLLLRVAEGQLMSISDSSSAASQLNSDDARQTLRRASLHMINVITDITELYSSALAIVGSKYARDSVKKMLEKVSTTITNDGEAAIVVVQESFAFLVPIFKLKFLSTIYNQT